MNQLEDRKYLIIGLFALVGLMYIARLFCIQVIDDSYKLDANNQAFRYTTEYPVRGYSCDDPNLLVGRVRHKKFMKAELPVTPLQNGNIVAIIANKGWYYTPHIVKAIAGNENDTLLNRFRVKHYTRVTNPDYYTTVNRAKPSRKGHSAFVCFAPIENAGFGATWAGPIATLLMEKYLTGKITRPELEKRMIEANLIARKP